LIYMIRNDGVGSSNLSCGTNNFIKLTADSPEGSQI